MIRLMTLLLVPALLVLAAACDDGDDNGDEPTDTPVVTDPTATSEVTGLPDGTVDEALFRLTVTIDGEPLSENHPGVGAQVNGNNCETSLAVDGALEMHVASDEGKAGCGTSGDTVVFVLLGAGDPGGTEADETGVWDNTQLNELEINFTTE